MLLTQPLLINARDTLRDNLSNITQKEKSIRLTNERRVPAYAGEEFINLFGVVVSNEWDPIEITRVENYSLSIGITRRLEGIPTDSSAESIYVQDLITRAKEVMTRRAYEIISIIDGNWGIPALIRQDEDLAEIADFCILSPLGYLGSAELEEVYADHFHLEDPSDRPQALFLELSFGGLQAYFTKASTNV